MTGFIRRPAELDGTEVETLELAEVGTASVRKRHPGGADATAGRVAQSLQNHGDPKLQVLPDAMPRKACHVDLDRQALRRSRQLEAYGLVDDPDITRKERQRFADVPGA